MRTETIKCDNCGKVKGETNRWFQAFAAVAENEIANRYVVMAAPLKTPLQSAVLVDLCGEPCVIAMISKWMGEQK